MSGCQQSVVAIVVALVGVAGCTRRESNRAIDPANQIPFGHVDTPTGGAQVPMQVGVGGWAMDDRGIKEVRVFVDGRYVNAFQLNTEREDVSKAYPPFARNMNLHGWTSTITFDAPGPHTLVIQAVDSDGATRDIGTIAVTSQDR